jgi:parvulin-like peptidyl-prolyl isomerase
MNDYRTKLITYSLILLISFILYLPALSAQDQGPGSEIQSIFDVIQQQQGNNNPQKRSIGGSFSLQELWLNLSPDTVLATCQGEPLVYVAEFNRRAKRIYGEDLFQARYNALRKIIDTRLVAALSKDEGLKNDAEVIKNVAVAEGEVKAAQMGFKNEISDAQARRYYRRHVEKFRQSDRGTRVLFVVKGERKEAQAVLERIKKGKPSEKFSFSPNPLPGSQLPAAVQDAIFHLEPGESTKLVEPPIGFFIAKLIERNDFDHFEAGIIRRKDSQQCQEVLEKIKNGEKFENLVPEKEQLSIALKELPEEVQRAVPDMEPGEISTPIGTPLGYFLVKLQRRWSDAEIITAKLIQLNSKTEGEKILSRLKESLELEKGEEQLIAGKRLPTKLRNVAKRLKVGEYSNPVKTLLGYYLVKVLKRARQMYKPFNLVKDDIKQMIRIDEISDEAALNYYNFYRSHYQKSGQEYILDIILSETLDQGDKILAELKKAPDKKKKEALFFKYRKDLRSVSAELLPLECQKIAQELKSDQVSPVIFTQLGYFILRLNKKEYPAYLPFEGVKLDIKNLLVEQTEQRKEHEAEMYITQVEEEALEKVHYTVNVLQSTDSVSGEEAEEWWQENKDKLLGIFGIPESQGEEVLFGSRQAAMKYKKLNSLSDKYRQTVQNLYAKNNVIIYDNLLKQ